MGQVTAPFASRYLRIARVLPDPARGGANRVVLTSKQLCVARHLAHDGATAEEIHNALGLTCTIAVTRKKLLKANIRYRQLKHGRRR